MVLLGALLRPLGAYPWLLALPASLYALRHGLAETLNFPLQPPGSRWQVPTTGIGRWWPGPTLTWGMLLGPGLVTRNPYGGIWLLPFLIGLHRSLLLAALVGGTHGAARALGVLHNRRVACNVADTATWRPLWSWRLWDGMLLLAGAGALVGVGLWTLATR